MTEDYQAARNEAARLVGRLISQKRGRDYLAANGYRSGQAIITAHYDELISSVLDRAHRHPSPVTIAILRSSGELNMMAVGVADKDATGNGNLDVGGSSTIGMLYDGCKSGGYQSFQLTEWEREAMAKSMPEVADLVNA
ncbi:hypothetical protein [Kocuria sp.]|uniref:hypothetical protein n=1 Tax=Kocuria sp. TaxID=1871328 RepID=UPI0026E01888|nr:hypothetical protein [Kocuria sp.]MDO5618191.1 hypothetical protein [Kocuria sp.]